MTELPKDLREMNEEQFADVFNLLRGITKNWSEFPPELLIENNRFLLVIRCALGLSQREFGIKLDASKQWVKEFESGRRKIIHNKPALRYVQLIRSLIEETKPSLSIGIAKWKEFKRFRHDIKPKRKNEPLVKMTEEELKQLFKEVEKQTNHFTNFEPAILIENPQSFKIFRLSLGFSHDKLRNY